MFSDEQREERLRKFERIIDSMPNCSNIDEISLLTGIPSSTIQRYLNKTELYEELAEVKNMDKEELKETFENTKRWLKQAKENGLSKGGKTSQEKHGFSKTKGGLFNGSGHNR